MLLVVRPPYLQAGTAETARWGCGSLDKENMWREQDAQRRAIIVHPRYNLDVRQPPPPPTPGAYRRRRLQLRVHGLARGLSPLSPLRLLAPISDWHALPLEVVSLIAAHLELPHDVLRLSATCRDTR